MLIGTVAYMSPEQARGERVDQRTDLWAFGCVLYEMLTGRAPFQGATLPDTLAAIVAKDPDWSALPSDTPAEVRRVLRRCLEKEWHQRLRDAGDVRIALEDAAEAARRRISDHHADARGAEAASKRRPPRAGGGRLRPGRGLAGLALVRRTGPPAVGRRPWRCGSRSRRRRPTIRWRSRCHRTASSSRSSPAPAGGRCCGFGRSTPPRRGRFPGPRAPRTRSGRRTADRSRSSPIVTSGTSTSSWARFKCLPQPTAGAAAPGGPTAPSSSNPLRAGTTWSAISSSGGPPLPFESPPGRFPQFLPDGRHFLYFGFPADLSAGVFVAAVDGSGARQVLEANSAAVYSSGHLLFVRGSTLLAQRFDLASLAVSGSAFPVAADLHVAFGHAPLSAAAEGPIVFRAGSAAVLRQFVWRRPRRERDRQAGSTDGNVALTVACTG